MKKDLEAPFRNLEMMRSLLYQDIDLAADLHRKLNTEATRRILVRAYFTLFEGEIYALKQTILSFEYVLSHIPQTHNSNSYIRLFTEEEKAMLEEFSYDMSSGGKARKIDYYPRMPENVKFTFNMFCQSLHIESDIDYNCLGWNKLSEAQKIRNRITHPKSPEDLQVSKQNLNDVEVGLQWFQNTFETLLDRYQAKSQMKPRTIKYQG